MNTNCVGPVLGVEMGVEGLGKMEHVFAKVFWFKLVRVILPVESALFSPFLTELSLPSFQYTFTVAFWDP